ncbi:MAG: ABATE domain-containing protein [Acidobacteriaceae bacterium]|nr:ABATE domain-containing protein [Acidobacteriaceae bacterium]
MSPFSQKSPFEFTGGNLCLDFANTIDHRGSARATELLTDYARLVRWGEESSAVSRKTAEKLSSLATESPGNAQLVVRRAVQLRDAIYDLFSAVAQRRGIPSTALGTVNRAAQVAAEHAQVVSTNRHFTWDWVSPESHLDSMLWPIARAAAELLTSEDVGNVRRCASATCDWLFLDKTKNHRRRWCDMKTCGNRDKARRYYQKQKAG